MPAGIVDLVHEEVDGLGLLAVFGIRLDLELALDAAERDHREHHVDGVGRDARVLVLAWVTGVGAAEALPGAARPSATAVPSTVTAPMALGSVRRAPDVLRFRIADPPGPPTDQQAWRD